MKFRLSASILLAMLASLFVPHALAGMAVSKAPEGAQVYFISPQDGDTVPSKFTVKFGLKGMGVAPAGVERDNTGHHHLLIDVTTLPDLKQPLPASEQVRHFGGGQTETVVELAPGTHTLQLLLGNHLHIPHHKPVLSEKITVTVK
ncbi:DUF4399 domain-containing protein [Pseudomaricurvus alcaniphilus]|uniref:DUF4399 domain-containing protein n=1 Tax=Pseudomaricurvus alcaniphilus TaxID=1166482 RepID=UPI00140E529D|nr:DUF4399 domain-containing protein [Pseudomaricurvus alcaniphilus]NHN36567.1 DUF4399 domain-containing protein [Pseudomaricurvus alcaniphilus]